MAFQSIPSILRLAGLVSRVALPMLLLQCAMAQQAAREEVCFFADRTTPSSARKGCEADPLKLLRLRELATAIEVLNIPQSGLKLLGCRVTKFATAPLVDSAGAVHYTIYYPVLEQPAENYIAPLLHEFGHVHQIESTGGSIQLLEKYHNRYIQIELGADFLTGVVLGHFISGGKTRLFQDSLILIGLYREAEIEAHGTTDQRIGAFRFGYFMPRREFNNEIAKAYLEYDDKGFPMLVP